MPIYAGKDGLLFVDEEGHINSLSLDLFDELKQAIEQVERLNGVCCDATKEQVDAVVREEFESIILDELSTGDTLGYLVHRLRGRSKYDVDEWYVNSVLGRMVSEGLIEKCIDNKGLTAYRKI